MSYLVAELIRKKRDGGILDADEMAFLVKGFADASIPDYQASAWLMAAFLRGLDKNETLSLTREMKNSGRHLNWRELSSVFRDARFADKHSTGGVGDKVSLILAPLAVCLGLKVPMMSGRGLGFTGGTVDKLESIKGFNMYPEQSLMVKCLDEVGTCMMAQAKDLCPADKKLYALRDVTATVESIPLITASIVAKKWAEGVDAIVFDVKAGSAAFMPNVNEARLLAKSLVNAASGSGMKATAQITRMEEPLGAFIGNALEVKESISILRAKYESDSARQLAAPLRELSISLAAEMASLAGVQKDFTTAHNAAEKALASGDAYDIFTRMLRAQGALAVESEALPKAPLRVALKSATSGFVQKIQARHLGLAGLKIGVGRQKEDDRIDPATGFELAVQVGSEVAQGDVLLWMHLQRSDQATLIEDELKQVFSFASTASAKLPPLLIEKVNDVSA